MPYQLVAPPKRLFRVGRAPSAFAWPPPPAPLALSGPFDLSRWDDPDGAFSTLYAASDPLGAFIEVLPYYRHSPSDFLERLYAATAADDPDVELDFADGELKPGFFARVLGSAGLDERARLVDMDDPRTHAELNRELPQLLEEFGLVEFDRGVAMSQDRRITRRIAGHLHQRCAGRDIVGIRYESRRYRARECWALWNTAEPLLSAVEADPVVPAIPALRLAAELLDIHLPAE